MPVPLVEGSQRGRTTTSPSVRSSQEPGPLASFGSRNDRELGLNWSVSGVCYAIAVP
jgi:hypothetical protein